jgi:hypothetical protein
MRSDHNTRDSMVPERGNHSEPYTATGPATGEVPGYGSVPYIGNHTGNHATGNLEPLTKEHGDLT